MIIFSFVAAIGFVLSLLVHISTFTSYDLMGQFPQVMGMHIGVMVIAAPMIFSVNKPRASKNSWKQFLAPMPSWVRFTLQAFFYYTIINFFICVLVMAPAGSPVEHDGKYFLKIKGESEREVSREQFEYSQRMVLRTFSGHWMLFCLMPTFFFLFRRPRQLIVQ